MEMMPESVGKASRAWDEQHLDLHAAAGQIGAAPTTGFTSTVAGAASRFTREWERHTEETATLCEERSDGLRTAIADWIATDGQASLSSWTLQGYLREIR